MENKTKIGIGVLLLAGVGYYFYNKKKETIVETDTEVEFENADGNTSNRTLKVVKVKDYKNAILQSEVYSDWFSCLITTTGKIPIGNYSFWDWEDDCLNY